MRRLWLLALPAAAVCTTASSRREQSPRLTLTTVKPFEEVRDCISADFDKEHYPLSFMPKQNGGTFAYRVRGKLFWWLSLNDDGATRRVELFGAKDRELTERLTRCT